MDNASSQGNVAPGSVVKTAKSKDITSSQVQVLWRQDMCRHNGVVRGVMCRHGVLRRHGICLHDTSSGGTVSSGNESSQCGVSVTPKSDTQVV